LQMDIWTPKQPSTSQAAREKDDFSTNIIKL
jgi:hypothetical protein